MPGVRPVGTGVLGLGPDAERPCLFGAARVEVGHDQACVASAQPRAPAALPAHVEASAGEERGSGQEFDAPAATGGVSGQEGAVEGADVAIALDPRLASRVFAARVEGDRALVEEAPGLNAQLSAGRLDRPHEGEVVGFEAQGSSRREAQGPARLEVDHARGAQRQGGSPQRPGQRDLGGLDGEGSGGFEAAGQADREGRADRAQPRRGPEVSALSPVEQPEPALLGAELPAVSVWVRGQLEVAVLTRARGERSRGRERLGIRARSRHERERNREEREEREAGGRTHGGLLDKGAPV